MNEHGKHDKTYRIEVNGVSETVNHDVLTYEEVVSLAFPQPVANAIYSVMFEKAKDPKDGDLVAGQSITVKEGTEFDVDDTGRS